MARIEIAKGASWMLLFRLVERSLGLVSTIILARLLMPADFGLVAMAMSVIALIELASAFSLEVPLIQKQSPTREHYDTAWTLNLTFAAACAAATALLAYPAAAFYDDERLAPVMLVLAGGWLVQGFENIGTVNFRRSMNFARETVFLLGKRLVAFAVTLTIALSFRSYWALIAGVVTGRVVGVMLSYAMEGFRPRFSLAGMRDLFSMSTWLFINNLLHFGTSRLSHFLIGRVHGATSLGLYTIGSELAYLPQTELVAPINRALFPGYSRMTESMAEMRRGFLDVNAVIAIMVFPASAGLACVAEFLVPVLLGPNWLGAVPIIQVLAFAGGLAALTSNTYSAYLALGRPRVLTWVLLVELVVLAPGILILSALHGVLGVAYAELIAVVVGALCSFPLLVRTLQIGWLGFVANLWRPLLAATGMAAIVTLAGGYGASQGLGPFAMLPLLVAVGAACYALLLCALWLLAGRPPGAESMLLEQVRLRFAAKRLAGAEPVP